MTKVYITDTIFDIAVEERILGNDVSTTVDYNAEVLMVWNKIIDQSFIEQFPQLKAIVKCTIGYDNIDINYAKTKNITVSNVPDYCIAEVADTTLAFILNIIRNVNRMDFLARTATVGWQSLCLKSMHRTSSYVVGLVGTGNIGRNVIDRLSAFNIKTVFYDPYISLAQEQKLKGTRISSLKELLSLSDIVSIHTPLTTETKAMVDEEFLKNMKPGASLVNTARGKIIKDLDLVYEYLMSGHLSCIAFDVLPSEPPSSSKLIDAWKNKLDSLQGRVTINPHTAFFSQESLIEVREKASHNAKLVLLGQQAQNIVN